MSRTLETVPLRVTADGGPCSGRAKTDRDRARMTRTRALQRDRVRPHQVLLRPTGLKIARVEGLGFYRFRAVKNREIKYRSVAFDLQNCLNR